jgi:hypothetical protein
MEATAACSTRAEALHGAARYCRNKGIHERGYEFAAQGLAIVYPNSALAVEDWIYQYGLLDELAVNAYWIGKYAECVEACDRLLNEGKLPTEKRDRVLKNKQFAMDKLPKATPQSPPKDIQILRVEIGIPDQAIEAPRLQESTVSLSGSPNNTPKTPAQQPIKDIQCVRLQIGPLDQASEEPRFQESAVFLSSSLNNPPKTAAQPPKDIQSIQLEASQLERSSEAPPLQETTVSQVSPASAADTTGDEHSSKIESERTVLQPPPAEDGTLMTLLQAAWQNGELARPNDEVIGAFVDVAAWHPARAKALLEAAHFCRVKGFHDACLLFCEAGFALATPKEKVPVQEDPAYTTGLHEEYSIAANYSSDPARKDRGFAACNWLALDRTSPARSRDLARWNIFFYLKSAGEIMPSFTARPVGFVPPDGYHSSNPSVTRVGNEIILIQRAVNFTLTAEGTYRTPNDAPVHTRNFLLRLDKELAIQSSSEILPPADMPIPAFREVQGFEDARLFSWRNSLWCIACVRELTPEGWCDQVLARIDDSEPSGLRLTNWRVLHPQGPRQNEKNWMPKVIGEALRFIYKCDPARIVDEEARTVVETTSSIAADDFRGGTQSIVFDGGWLALIHEVSEREKLRYYQHRFVWFDSSSQLRRVSLPFFFMRKGVEFAAGLARHPDGRGLLISFGVGDNEAWIATVGAGDVRRLLDDAAQLPSGAPKSAAGTSRTATSADDIAHRRWELAKRQPSAWSQA